MTVDSGSTTAWLLCATALVMLMTPGVGFFYGGLVRKRISSPGCPFIIAFAGEHQWIIIGYSLAFGPDVSGIIGSLEYVGLNNVPFDAPGLPYPPMLFMMYQLTFAAVTLAIVTSGMAERIKLSAFLIFGLIWITVVYEPVAHWYGGRRGSAMGFLDFAGVLSFQIMWFCGAGPCLCLSENVQGLENTLSITEYPMTLLGEDSLVWLVRFNGGECPRSKRPCSKRSSSDKYLCAAVGTCMAFLSRGSGEDLVHSGLVSGAVAGLGAITPCAGMSRPCGL